eukprot:scaffold78636_cov14-Tisochrysis_lutea.AAC.1
MQQQQKGRSMEMGSQAVCLIALWCRVHPYETWSRWELRRQCPFHVQKALGLHSSALNTHGQSDTCNASFSKDLPHSHM